VQDDDEGSVRREIRGRVEAVGPLHATDADDVHFGWHIEEEATARRERYHDVDRDLCDQCAWPQWVDTRTGQHQASLDAVGSAPLNRPRGDFVPSAN